ncbi:MAG: hypothetical protein LBU77_05375 [Clostridiales bacterium]|jgi:hypothetical protein|nr:hypothetical protein [Clostridiales bacterium]
METSKQYRYLEKRIKQIKHHFHFNQAINGITPLQSDRLRGLRLLCHAEFEDYFESTAIRLLDEAKKKWNAKKVANFNLASLFIWHEKIQTSDSSTTKAYRITSDFEKSIKNNHGIQEKNIRALFEPLGYKTDDFDSTFISDLSSFGKQRGETAHTSAKKTQQPLDLNTEISLIDRILQQIIDFEGVINRE